jgi:hypothetical protein
MSSLQRHQGRPGAVCPHRLAYGHRELG